MKDADAIHDAYAATVGELYKTMFRSYLIAAGNKTEEKNADNAFQAGLAVARAVRSQALALL